MEGHFLADSRSGYRLRTIGLAAAMVLAAGTAARAQEMAALAPSALKKLSFEELLDIEVTSVSRQPVRLASAASAIQVISQEEIRRSGASSIPQALRLASNLQVAQVNASQWAISARGFNNVLANKLLVMADGRTVYTPLYAGVFWDVQDYLMEDLERIEVISGPGGTLWGANAVNGVINVISKASAATQGIFLEAGAGSELESFGGIRYGGELGPDFHYRFYAKAFEQDGTQSLAGMAAGDDWSMAQGGFRIDRQSNSRDLLTLQGDYYDGRPNPDGTVPVEASGGNLLGRWTRTLGTDADVQLQWYVDHTTRDFGTGFLERLDTYDVDWQHRFGFGPRQELIWGLGIRWMDHEVRNLPLFGFFPAHKELKLYSGFIQDEITLVDNLLGLTVGSKFEHNSYTGLEFQPSIRATLTPADRQTLWAGVSRAVKTPARIDREFKLNFTPAIGLLWSDPGYDSEEVLAYELGWRVQPKDELSLSIAAFFNEYDELRSAAPGPPPFGLPITIRNGVRGESHGVEFSALYEAASWWRLRGGYTYFHKDLEVQPGRVDLNNATAESNDPEHQIVIQSLIDLPADLELDAVLRHVQALPSPAVESYTELDVRLGWRPLASLEFALVGSNLLDGSHPEFVPSSPAPREIERSVHGRVTWRY